MFGLRTPQELTPQKLTPQISSLPIKASSPKLSKNGSTQTAIEEEKEEKKKKKSCCTLI